MTRCCKVVCTVTVGGEEVEAKTWQAVNIMATGSTRGWATRQFNLWRRERRDKIVSVTWDAYYGAPDHSHISGKLTGVNAIEHKRGVFE